METQQAFPNVSPLIVFLRCPYFLRPLTVTGKSIDIAEFIGPLKHHISPGRRLLPELQIRKRYWMYSM
jgi:hypothetical protein